MSRLSPKPETIRELFALSGNQCAFPECNHALINDKGTFIAQICHIEAANIGGQRYNPTQSDEERRSAANLLILCYAHHRETDDESIYTPLELFEIKTNHEDRFRKQKYDISDATLTKVQTNLNSQLERLIGMSENSNQMLSEVMGIMKGKTIQVECSAISTHETKLQIIRDLRKQGKPFTAMNFLTEIKSKDWNSLNNEAKYKVIANLGMCFLDLGKRARAGEIFAELETIDFRSSDSVSYLALGYALARRFNDFDKLFSELSDHEKDNENLWAAFVERHRTELPIQEIETKIPGKVVESAPVAFAIANLYFDCGKVKEAQDKLSALIIVNDQVKELVIEGKAALGTRLLQNIIDPEKFLLKLQTQAELDTLHGARDLLSEAWQLIDEQELAKAKSYILTNRGVCNKLIGETNQAILDFQKSYDFSQEYLVFKNLVSAYVETGNISMVDHLLRDPKFSEALSENQEFDLRLMRAKVLSLDGRIADSMSLLQSELGQRVGKKRKELLLRIGSLYINRGSGVDAEPVCNKLITEYPEDISGYLLLAFINGLNDNKEQARLLFDRASEKINPTTNLLEINELANGYGKLGAFEKAIPIYERIANKNSLNSISEELITCYHRIGDLQAALAIADNLFELHPDSIFLTDIISLIYEEINNYDQSIDTIKYHLAASPSSSRNDVFQLRLATLYAKQRDRVNALYCLRQIKGVEGFSLLNRFLFAELLITHGEGDRGMCIAFETRNQHVHDSYAHSRYINACLKHAKSEEQLFPERVGHETAVTVRLSNGTERIYLLTSLSTEGENVLRPHSGLSQLLFGKGKGDQVKLSSRPGFDDNLTVVMISDIFGHAFRESLELFQGRFVGEQGVIAFSYDKNNIEGTFEQALKPSMLQNQRFSEQALNLYEQRKLTIGALALLSKRSFITQWHILISTENISLASYTQDESIAWAAIMSQEIPVVIELTSLLTCFIVLANHSLLLLLPGRKIIAKSTIEELESWAEELKSSVSNGLMNFDIFNGHLVTNYTSGEVVGKYWKQVLDIIAWSKTHCEIVSPMSLLGIQRDTRERMQKAIGACSYHTILLSQELQAAVLSDDDVFKSVLREGNNPLPVSTYQLAEFALTSDTIDQAELQLIVRKLLEANYTFIPPDAEILWECFDRSGFRLRNVFKTAVKGLLILNPTDCARQVVMFLKKVYLVAGLITTRQQTLVFILQTIAMRSDFGSLRQLLRKEAFAQYSLLPNLAQDFSQTLDVFE